MIVDPEAPRLASSHKPPRKREIGKHGGKKVEGAKQKSKPAKQYVPPRDAAKTISSSVCRVCKRDFGSPQARAAHLGGAPACRALLGLPPLPQSQYATAVTATGEFDRCVTCNLAPPLTTFSRSLSGYWRKTCDLCRAENEAAAAEKKAAAAREDEAWKAAGVPADLPALREAYAREQAAKKQRV